MNNLIEYVEKLVQTTTSTKGHLFPKGMTVNGFGQAKKVTKPWGFELWLSDASDTPYALKIIYVKKGTKTSLQLHNEKSEHNCVLSGTISLHYQNPKTESIDQVTLGPGHVIKILPETIHRIEALTDVVLVEASSNQLYDVVRLKDDYRRPSGKIDSEHSK